MAVSTPVTTQTFVRLQPALATGTISANGGSVSLSSSNLGGFGTVKIQTLDTYSGTWEVQCSANGSTYDADAELKLTAADGSTTVTSVTDAVGIWDVGNAGGCRSVRVIATAGFAATNVTLVISATQTGGAGSGGGGGGASDTEMPDAAALADNTANPTVPGVASFNMCFDGVTWDRCPSGDGGLGTATSNTGRMVLAQTSIFRSMDLDLTEEDIKTSAGEVCSIYAVNTSATAAYIKFYNATAANVSVGTTTPVLTFWLPATGAANPPLNISLPGCLAFGTAISAAATAGFADTDVVDTGANAVIINVGYR